MVWYLNPGVFCEKDEKEHSNKINATSKFVFFMIQLLLVGKYILIGGLFYEMIKNFQKKHQKSIIFF